LIRVVVGLKKEYDQAVIDNKDFSTAFDAKKLFISIIIAVAIGSIAGALGIASYVGQDISRDTFLAVIGMGYAGTDFIEGLLLTKPEAKLPAAALPASNNLQ
jgi:hypothetical protein